MDSTPISYSNSGVKEFPSRNIVGASGSAESKGTDVERIGTDNDDDNLADDFARVLSVFLSAAIMYLVERWR